MKGADFSRDRVGVLDQFLKVGLRKDALPRKFFMSAVRIQENGDRLSVESSGA